MSTITFEGTIKRSGKDKIEIISDDTFTGQQKSMEIVCDDMFTSCQGANVTVSIDIRTYNKSDRIGMMLNATLNL